MFERSKKPPKICFRQLSLEDRNAKVNISQGKDIEGTSKRACNRL